ncbi:TPA: SLATT domain-containing protein [Clostridium botulinum]|uniref:SLATT domain-containing protein n=1 Tax=Clostridium botulinum TaxID=1491 RepID=UPI0011172764|nr:SLATT domain-containing protein [Clostridium botulinum]NFB52174.1 SLATT domain-containing protein [Clostridium botulinum]NFC86450.1 SLATT domain-containing protein [Clostridium botulinum]NFD04000.1 SLATT domain-containing protein [Clostridium botulinum]NFD96492.1 SLATT domain-containing protein [Clostridium botulinum]
MIGGIIINNIEILESQLRQIFASVVWTHKIQEKQADIYLKRYNRLERSRILLSALTSSGIFAVVFVDNFRLKIITAGVSAVSLYINTYFKSYDLKSLQKKHKGSAIELLEIREDLMSVLCDVAIGKYSEEELFKKRDEFLERKIEIAKNALDAGDKAVKEASNSLKIREDNTYSDNEIDSYLPILARKNK